MLFNLSKCKVLCVGRRNPNFKYSKDDVWLEESKEERDLGVIVTESFKGSKQCSNAAAKANRVLGIIEKKNLEQGCCSDCKVIQIFNKTTS